MRQRPRYSLLLAVGVTFCLTPNSSQAQCSDSFPTGYVPFQSVYYVSEPDASADRLLVGKMTVPAYQRLSQIPLPNAPNQRFCGQVELAPGFLTDAYVPTAAERSGDFSPFAQFLFDPQTFCLRFLDGRIPANRIPDSFAWRIPRNASVPFLEINMNKTCFLEGDAVTATIYRLSNPTPATVAVELKAWQGFPDGTLTSYDNRGSDGSLELPPDFVEDSPAFDLFTVTPETPRGTYQFSSRLLDWVTGRQWSARRNFFLIPGPGPTPAAAQIRQRAGVSHLQIAKFSRLNRSSRASFRKSVQLQLSRSGGR